MASTIAVCAALLIAGCGDSGSPSTGSTESSTSPAASTESSPPASSGRASTHASKPVKAHTDPSKPANSTPLLAKKPKPHVVPPRGPPPKKHVISRDLERGSGAAIHRGDVITVDFLGAYYETGEVLMSSWERDEPFTFRLGGGKGILGWEHALQGMRLGGRRELILPAHLTSRYALPSEERSQIYVIDLRGIGRRASGPSE